MDPTVFVSITELISEKKIIEVFEINFKTNENNEESVCKKFNCQSQDVSFNVCNVEDVEGH